MSTAGTTPDPIANVPDPETIRRMIAANVEHAQLLRQLLRLSLRKEKLTTPARRLARKAVARAR